MLKIVSALSRSLGVVATIVACSGCATQILPSDREAAEAEIRKAKLETWRSLYNLNDADGLDAFLADDFVLIGGESGFTPKAEEIEWLRKNSWEGPQDFVYTIEKIVFLNRDAAVVYGTGTSTRTLEDGEPCNHRYISSNTFRREGGEWRPVTSHVSDARCDLVAD